MEQPTLRERAAKIARLLEGWHVRDDESPRENAVTLIGPEGQGIYLLVNQYNYKGRIVIGGTYPHQAPYGSFHPHDAIEITVSEGRPVGEIAKEIKRRFLPIYTQQYAEAQARAEATRDTLARERALMARLAPIVGAMPHTRTEASANVGEAHVKINTDHGKCMVTLREVTEEVAVQILELLKACQ